MFKRICSLICVLSLLVGLFSFLGMGVQAEEALEAEPWKNKVDVSWIDSSKKLVAFTFDDGPIGTYSTAPSQRILDVMEEYKMHCTFFYWGNKINNSNIGEIERAYSLGCEIGNHSYSHPYLTNMNQSQIQDEIKKTNDLLSPVSGNSATLIRPPYGSVNNTVSSSVNGPLINWSVDSADWNNGNYNSVLNKLRNVKDGDIVLMHENYEFTAQAVETVVPELIEKGFVIVSVSELMMMKGIELKAGTTYTNQAVGKPNVYKSFESEQVDAQIVAIGKVTLESEAAIEAARAAYNALTYIQTTQLDNYSILEAAEETLNELKKTAALVLDVEEKINAIGRITLESELSIRTARAAYESLSDDQKLQIKNYDILTSAEAVLSILKEASEALILESEGKIDAIGEVTLESEDAIAEARAAYDALTEAEKAKVKNYDTLTAAEDTFAGLKEAAAMVLAVEQKIDVIGEVTLESETAIKEARDAFNTLTIALQLQVQNIDVLEEAEATWAELKANYFPFTDVSGWYEEAARYAYRNGLMNGTSDATFSPDGIVTRAQLVTILYRMEGEPEVAGKRVFTDIPVGQWYSNAIEWAEKGGIVNGVGNKKFNPDGEITREQIATILHRYSGYLRAYGSLDSFPDKDSVSSFAEVAMAWAVGERLINGVTSNNGILLAPKATATRAQIATIIMRYEKTFVG